LTRSVFDRYNITSEEDLRQAAVKLGAYIQEKKVTFTVTPEALLGTLPLAQRRHKLLKNGGEGGI
jgi:hypothetical protein